MFSFAALGQKFVSTFGARPVADMTTVHMLCVSLLSDVPQSLRESMLERLETMRRANDVWHVRSALFDVIARHHGERVAKERLLELDSKLLPYATLDSRM